MRVHGLSSLGSRPAANKGIAALHWFAALWCLFAWTLAVASDRVDFSIAGQSADKALVEFAKQAELSVLFPTEKINQIATNAVYGKYPVDEALGILLRSTGLSGELSGKGVLTVRINHDPGDPIVENRKSWISLLLSSLAAAFTASPPAQAQESATVALEEIVVTAQKREENLQTTPIAVRAFDEDALRKAGVQQFFQIDKVEPDVQVGTMVGSPQVAIRGIAGANPGPSGEQPNAVHVNGAYLPRQGAYNGHFFDVERMEVLKGPQGTLYGRNAVGGAINIITRKPGKDFGGYGQIEVGNFNYLRTEGALNAPLSDTVGVRLAMQNQRRDGYWENGMSDVGEQGARATFQWQPDQTQRLLFIYDSERSNNKGPANSTLASSNNPLVAIPPKWDNSAIFGSNPQSYYRENQYGATAQYDYSFEPATFTVIGTYRHLNQDDFGPNSAIPISVSAGGAASGSWTHHVGNFNQSTLEARLASANTRPLEWVLGVFALNQNNNGGVDDFTPTAFYSSPQGSASSRFDNPMDEAQAYAAFGQATWTPPSFERLHITAGARYSIDHKRGTTLTGGTQVIVPSIVTTDSETWNAVTWRGAVSFDVTDKSMLYASASKGYQAGGFAYAPPGFSPKYKPESAISYELGSKNEFFNDRLRVNVEAYYTDYTDKARTYFFVTPPAFNINVGISNYDVTYYGGSLSVQAALTRADMLNFNASYLAGESGGWQGSQIYPTIQDEASGERLRALAPWRGNASYSHTWDLFGGDLDTEVQMQYLNPLAAKTTLRSGGIVYTSEPESTRWDFLLRYAPAAAKWDVTAYVRNLENSYEGNYAYNQAQPGGSQFVTFSPMPPRTYGVMMNVRF